MDVRSRSNNNNNKIPSHTASSHVCIFVRLVSCYFLFLFLVIEMEMVGPRLCTTSIHASQAKVQAQT